MVIKRQLTYGQCSQKIYKEVLKENVSNLGQYWPKEIIYYKPKEEENIKNIEKIDRTKWIRIIDHIKHEMLILKWH